MELAFCKLEAEAIRQHTGSAGSFFTQKQYKKLKPLKTALTEVERTADYFFNLALDILLCVDILFCYDLTDEVPGKYCNRLTALVPKEYKRECECIFIERLRYAAVPHAMAI